MNVCLASCRSCCKFQPQDKYFAPIITTAEIAKLKTSKSNRKMFLPYKNSKEVSQIRLVKSKFSTNLFVCPFLDEKTQSCAIYRYRPMDCRFWPLLFMFNKKRDKIYLAHFNKNFCQITARMDTAAFKKYLDKTFHNWLQNKKIIF